MSTTWTSMSPAHFDPAAGGIRKARKVIAVTDTAPASLFPDLTPDLPAPKSAPPRELMPGEVPLFDLEET